MNILEYRPIFGTFSLGFENLGQNEVVEVLKLDKEAVFGYNNTHKQWFFNNFDEISTYKPKKSIDLAIFTPEIGGKVGSQAKDNFSFRDFQNCLDFLAREKPKFAIFCTESSAIELINTSDSYVRDGFGQLSKDEVIFQLQQMGYDAYLVAIDEADYGIPSHRRFAFYVATPKGYGFAFPKGNYTRSGRGKYKKHLTVADAIGDLGPKGEWVPYASDPQNVYQRNIRGKAQNTTWHHSRKIKDTQKETIACIREGQNASTTNAIKQRSGYNRPKWASTPTLDDKFYLVSSRYDSIHPHEDRPFTIREGARLLGLPDKLSFELKTSKTYIAENIYKSVSPIIGELMAIGLRMIG